MQTTLAACYSELGFNNVPFSITPDTSLFFPGGLHASAYRQLHHSCMNGSLAVLTGEIGLGKTLIVRCTIRSLPAQVRVAYLINPLLGFVGLLREIYSEFGAEPPAPQAGLAVLHKALVDLVLKGAAQGERFVVIVDEAHRLSGETLEMLRLLSNLETERAKLISLVLVGQPELETTLKLRSMRPLRERIGLWLSLSPLNQEECAAYVRHRLARTHGDGSFHFTPAALWWLHRKTNGVPRRINLACERAVLMAYTRRAKGVNWDMVRLACKEFSKVWR
jgi:general secretion pathway protein A